MVYIYKKKVGNKSYYYLRASQKKDGKMITKDIAYLGNTLNDVRKELEKIPKYKTEIRKAYKNITNFLESNRYIEKVQSMKLKKDDLIGDKLIEVEACRQHYMGEFLRQEKLTKEEIWRNFIIDFAFNTASIEGNTINLAEVRELLENEKTPKNKTLREIYDLQNTESVFNEILLSKDKISNEFIIGIHKKLLDKIDKRIGYRNQDVRVIRANFKATPAPYVKTDMDLLMRWFNKNKDKLHPLVLACVFHHKFEKIHPFMDGNGRTGRILLNYILLDNNYPPVIIRNKNREKYLRVMRKADKSDLTKSEVEDYANLVEFVSNEVVSSYWTIFL